MIPVERATSARARALLLLSPLLAGALLLAVSRAPAGSSEAFLSDAFYYYGPLRSLAFDGDLDLRNEAASVSFLETTRDTILSTPPEEVEFLKRESVRWGIPEEAFERRKRAWLEELRGLTPETWAAWVRASFPERLPNDFPPGWAVLAAPFYFAVRAIAPAPDSGEELPGYERRYRLSTHVATAVQAFLGLCAAYAFLRRSFDERTSLLSIWIVALGTNLAYFLGGITSHVASFLAVSVFLWLWGRLEDRPDRLSRWTLLGAAAGGMAICRWQEAIFLLLPAATFVRLLLRPEPGEGTPTRARLWAGVGCAAAAAVVAFAPQWIYWNAYFGTWLHWPHGSGYVDLGRIPSLILPSLFGRNGLVSTHPVSGIALLGLAAFARRHRPAGVLLLVAVLLETAVNASVADWYGGHAPQPIGNRRFAACVPAFAWGIAAILEAARGRRFLRPLLAAAFLGWGIYEQAAWSLR